MFILDFTLCWVANGYKMHSHTSYKFKDMFNAFKFYMFVMIHFMYSIKMRGWRMLSILKVIKQLQRELVCKSVSYLIT